MSAADKITVYHFQSFRLNVHAKFKNNAGAQTTMPSKFHVHFQRAAYMCVGQNQQT